MNNAGNHEADDDNSHPSTQIDSDLDDWLATLRVERDATERRRKHWLSQQAGEEGTAVDILWNLAQQGQPAAIKLIGTGQYVGVIRVVGSDFCAIHTNSGVDVLISYSELGTIRGRPGSDLILGSRRHGSAVTMHVALCELANLEVRVKVRTRHSNEAVSGRLHSVGTDVITLRLDRDDIGGVGDWVYVPLAAVAEVSVVESG